jgi:hypothetical protein
MQIVFVLTGAGAEAGLIRDMMILDIDLHPYRIRCCILIDQLFKCVHSLFTFEAVVLASISYQKKKHIDIKLTILGNSTASPNTPGAIDAYRFID